MPLPLLETTQLFNFPANALPKISFRAFGNDYAGVQFTAFEGDELAWDSDVYGRWRGPAPLHANVANLSIAGATYTRDVSEFTELATISSGAAPMLEWDLKNADSVKTIRVIAQKLSDDTFVHDATHTASPVTLPDLADGSYAIWARVESAYQKQTLPDDYFDVTGYTSIPDKFQYEVDDTTYVWDWLHDVGIRPADTAQIAMDGETVMYDEYNALMLSGGLETKGEWTTYIRSNIAIGGEWSALRLQVGTGTFTVGEGVLPAPGAALVKESDSGSGSGSDGNDSVGIPFDILARAVTAAKVLSTDKVRIAGAFATRSGPAVGYWDLHSDGTATQLGCGVADTYHVCEMALLNHFASDIWEDDDGTQWILTLANLRRYDAYKTDVQERLTLVPADTLGHPGGRCLRRDDALKFFTENFTQGQGNFYNRLQIQSDSRSSGVGTVFHGDNCAELFKGAIYGWKQDGQFDDETAIQYLARLVYDDWETAGMPLFLAKDYHWQRLCAVNADSGLRMLAAGISAETQDARWAIINSQKLQEASCDYRVRRMQAVETGAYAVAFTGDKVWKNIHITGEFVKACFTWDDMTEVMALDVAEAESAGIDTGKLPPYLLWKPIETAAGGGVWLQQEEEPDSGTYLTLATVSGQLQYSGTLPYDGSTWCRICFTVYDDGGTGNDAIEPDACCSNALCASGLFDPVDGCDDDYEIITQRKHIEGKEWYAIQISDPNDFVTRLSRKLDKIAVDVPNLWARIDSDADTDDLSTYTIRVPWNKRFVLPKPAKEHIDFVVLMPPCYEAVRAPVMERRD